MDDNDDQYRWESGYERTWFVDSFSQACNVHFTAFREVITEDETGSISATVNAINQKNRRQELAQLPNVRLGMVRFPFGHRNSPTL